MLKKAHPRAAGIAIVLVGVLFFIMGLSRRRSGGSAAFMVIGMAFILIGVRRMRRVPPGHPADDQVF